MREALAARFNAQPAWVRITLVLNCIGGIFLAAFYGLGYEDFSKEQLETFRAVVPVVRGSLMLIIWLWLWGGCVWIFTFYTEIDYEKVFRLDASRLPAGTIFHACQVVTTLWVVTVSLFSLTLGAQDLTLFNIPARNVPLLLVVGLSAMLVLPMQLFHMQTRAWLVQVCISVFTAPFGRAEFPEGFVADVFCSLSWWYDLEYTLCYYGRIAWAHGDEHGFCQHRNRTVFAPFLAGIPFVWRFLQCLRNYYDTRRVAPLLNAGKYLFSFSTSVLNAIFRFHIAHGEHPGTPGLQWWLALAITSTLYSYTWDIFMDWNLLEWRVAADTDSQARRGLYFRRRLLYGRRWIYPAIMVENLALRFCWVANVTRASAAVHPELWTFITALIELVRRAVWSLLRVEHQALSTNSLLGATSTALHSPEVSVVKGGKVIPV